MQLLCTADFCGTCWAVYTSRIDPGYQRAYPTRSRVEVLRVIDTRIIEGHDGYCKDLAGTRDGGTVIRRSITMSCECLLPRGITALSSQWRYQPIGSGATGPKCDDEQKVKRKKDKGSKTKPGRVTDGGVVINKHAWNCASALASTCLLQTDMAALLHVFVEEDKPWQIVYSLSLCFTISLIEI